MPKVSLAFFTAGPIYVLIGMGLGIFMGASDDHSLAPAHAHLNLIGFAMMSVMGAFYGLAGDKASARLAWINFWVLNLAVVLMIPSLCLVLKSVMTVLPVLVASEFVAVAAVILFLVNVIRVWRKA